jgi:hypothetical protein
VVSEVRIEDRNIFREYVTINRGTHRFSQISTDSLTASTRPGIFREIEEEKELQIQTYREPQGLVDSPRSTLPEKAGSLDPDQEMFSARQSSQNTLCVG